MAYIVKADLYTVIYQAILDEITRTDDTIITRAINAGIKEVKSYLSRWDLTRKLENKQIPFTSYESITLVA